MTWWAHTEEHKLWVVHWALGETSVSVGFDRRKVQGQPQPGPTLAGTAKTRTLVLGFPSVAQQHSSHSASYSFLSHNFICGLREFLMQTEDVVWEEFHQHCKTGREQQAAAATVLVSLSFNFICCMLFLVRNLESIAEESCEGVSVSEKGSGGVFPAILVPFYLTRQQVLWLQETGRLSVFSVWGI